MASNYPKRGGNCRDWRWPGEPSWSTARQPRGGTGPGRDGPEPACHDSCARLWHLPGTCSVSRVGIITIGMSETPSACRVGITGWQPAWVPRAEPKASPAKLREGCGSAGTSGAGGAGLALARGPDSRPRGHLRPGSHDSRVPRSGAPGGFCCPHSHAPSGSAPLHGNMLCNGAPPDAQELWSLPGHFPAGSKTCTVPPTPPFRTVRRSPRHHRRTGRCHPPPRPSPLLVVRPEWS